MPKITDNLPRGASNEVMPIAPCKDAIAVTVDDSISSATTVTLDSDTTMVEVNALAQGVFLKYGTGASSSDFDEFIQAGFVRNYVIPNGVTQISVIEQAAGATVIIIEK